MRASRICYKTLGWLGLIVGVAGCGQSPDPAANRTVPGAAGATATGTAAAAGVNSGASPAGAGTSAGGATAGAPAQSGAGTGMVTAAGSNAGGASSTAAGASGAGAPAAGAAQAGASSGTGGAAAGGSPSAGASAGGASGAGGAMPTAGSAGMAGAGLGGAGNPVACTITASAETSSAIPTVGIVTWSTDMAAVDSASIEFGLVETGPTMVAPVDMSAPEYRTLLLGMKGSSDYVYHIVANSGGDSCTSEDFTITTGAVPSNISVTRQLSMPGSESVGFIVTSGGLAGFGGGGGGFGGGGGGGGGGALPVVIFDTDGDIVWWSDGPGTCSRAKMSWEGDNMWMVDLNVQNGGGSMWRVSMDGLDRETNVSGLSETHHDFTVLPGGIIAAAIWIGPGMDPDNALIERSPDGTIKTVVSNINTLYNSNGYHTNSIHYHPADDTYTLGDRNPNLFVKITRDGQLLWQFGGNNPIGNHFPASWQVNHGHHFLDNGNMVFFNNGNGGQSTVFEYALDESSWTATEVFRYSSNTSMVLGDAQKLPNGNYLVTYSNSGVMEEVNPSGSVVQSFTASSFGYADFRESLYGPPPR